MPREKNADAPSDDIGWHFGEPIDGKKSNIRCKLCGRAITGGVTRLKEHLAQKRGNIKGCPNVSTEIREQMMQHLAGNKAKKMDKQKRQVEFEATLRDDEYEGIVNVDDEEYDELEAVRQASIQSHHQWQERERFRVLTHGRTNIYDEGGFSGAQLSQKDFGGRGHSRGRGMRSLNVREAIGSERHRINPNTPEAKLRMLDPVLERSKSAKQPKISKSFLQNARKKLGEAVSKFIIYNRLPFNVAKSDYMQPMLDTAAEVGKGVTGPTPHEVAEVYLEQEYQRMIEYIQSFKGIWKERGVTLMCDGWTSGTGKHIINFLVYCSHGTIFLKSIDATDVPSRDATYYFGLMDKVVDEVGEEYVVQIVTDNEAAMKAGGKLLMQKRPNLYWTACAAHCIDLMLHDIGKKSNVQNLLNEGREITSFIYNHTWVRELMKKFTNDKELLRPAITRFATNFIALESIYKQKAALRSMFTSDEWRKSRFG